MKQDNFMWWCHIHFVHKFLTKYIKQTIFGNDYCSPEKLFRHIERRLRRRIDDASDSESPLHPDISPRKTIPMGSQGRNKVKEEALRFRGFQFQGTLIAGSDHFRLEALYPCQFMTSAFCSPPGIKGIKLQGHTPHR